MWYLIILYVWLSFKCNHTAFVKQDDFWFLNPSVAGVGEGLSQMTTESIQSCIIECSTEINCMAANYFPSDKTCTLMQVEDVLDDWEKDDDVTYITRDHELDQEGSFK